MADSRTSPEAPLTVEEQTRLPMQVLPQLFELRNIGNPKIRISHRVDKDPIPDMEM